MKLTGKHECWDVEERGWNGLEWGWEIHSHHRNRADADRSMAKLHERGEETRMVHTSKRYYAPDKP